MGVSDSKSTSDNKMISKAITNIVQNQITNNSEISNYLNSISFQSSGDVTLSNTSLKQSNTVNVTSVVITQQNENININQSEQNALKQAIKSQASSGFNLDQHNTTKVFTQIYNSIVNNNQFNSTFVNSLSTSLSNKLNVVSLNGNINASNFTVIQSNDATVVQSVITDLVRQIMTTNKISAKLDSSQSFVGSYASYILVIILIAIIAMLIFF